MKRWVVIVNLSLFILAAMAYSFYQKRHFIESNQSCLDHNLTFALLPLAREEVMASCATLSNPQATLSQRELALCILRNPPYLATTSERDLARFLEPCYTKVLKK